MSDIYIPGSNNWEVEKAKIIKEAKAGAWSGIPKTASAIVRDKEAYESPYLNLSDMQLPKSMVDIFRYCRYFYKFDSLVGRAVNNLAMFPVTDILYDDIEALPAEWDPKKDSPTLDMYKQTFKDLQMDKFLIDVGIDYWLYGNCFIFGEFENFSEDPNMPDYRWSKMFRLDPSKMTIDIDPLTQDKTYKWEVPSKLRKIYKEKRPKEKYDAIPDVIKKAIKENKAVVLNNSNIYHLSREGESGDGSVWGTPLVLNVLKQLAYRNLLRQAQEAIAREHIVPLRVYYMNPSEKVDMGGSWNKAASAFASQLENASKDPNYQIVSPVPVDVLNLGGQGRALLLTPEIDQLQAEILAGMGVPREFIFGGVSYSAASISLRTLENMFITYRSLLINFLNEFCIKRMAQLRGEWNSVADDPYLITVKMADLKMQDDIQQKQMIINLNAANKVSDEYMYNMLGIDSDKMKLQIDLEIFERMERERRMQMYQIETDYYAQANNMQFQAMLSQQQAQLFGPAPGAMQEEQTTQEGNNTQQTQPTNNSSKEQEKKASYDKVADFELQLNDLSERLASIDGKSRRELLSKVSAGARKLILDKIATTNVNTPGVSASRNIRLGNMREIDKHQELYGDGTNSGLLENISNTQNSYITENMSQPNPEKLPPRRDTLV